MRPRLQFKELVKNYNFRSFLQIARFGRLLSSIESRVYYHKQSRKRKWTKQVEKYEAELSAIVLKAIRDGDAAKLTEIAEAIKWVKTAEDARDLQRLFLINALILQRHHGHKFSFTELRNSMWGCPDLDKGSKAIADPKSTDGNRRLRKLCGEFEFKFEPTKRQKPKS
jgi:hypothetical protein